MFLLLRKAYRRLRVWFAAIHPIAAIHSLGEDVSDWLYYPSLRISASISWPGLSVKRRKKHRVVFLHNSYYHFFYLAKALRERGWDAVTVSLEPPDGPNANYYHGEDINLFSPDEKRFRENIEQFYRHALRRFDLLHFAGDGHMSFFPDQFPVDDPWDIVLWKSLGKKVAYTISGCNSGVAQSTVAAWSDLDSGMVVCDKCVWQLQPEVCNDEKNLAWGRKIERYCDLIFSEASPALDFVASAITIREPTTMCLDPAFWHPALQISEKWRIDRQDGELLVYHGVGNYDQRSRNGRNIKGTSFIVDAVEKIKQEGIPVKLIFATGMKNQDVRFLKAQCDVIVDQLNYGRYGATAREAMMLGKPTICYINSHEFSPHSSPRCMKELPLVSATENTIHEVLRDLLQDEERRVALGKAGRAYALKWHSATACAERYEQIYDQLMRGETIRYPQQWGTDYLLPS